MTGPPAVGIGVIGARSMVAERAILPAISSSALVELVAACSLGGPVPVPWTAKAVPTYESVIDHDDVEAVYVPLPNGMHRSWVERCAAAGKHVICEKPLAPTTADVRAMRQACDLADVLFVEAWMTPFDPRWAHTIGLARSGLIGDVNHTEASFTFTIDPASAANYRWSPDQGGGALLDVGIYCLGPAFELFGDHPSSVTIDSTPAPSGVDASSHIEVSWPSGATASAHCSFVDDEAQTLTLHGTTGSLALLDNAHTGGPAATTIQHVDNDGIIDTIEIVGGDPYRLMIEAFARAVRGVTAWPRPIERSIVMLETLTGGRR